MNVLSFFDGMSCGRIALDRAGIKPRAYFAAEIDKPAITVSKDNYADITQIGDVTKCRYAKGVLFTEAGSYYVGKIDLLIGGSPCQGFSFAGKQLNFSDERSKLFFEFVRVYNEIKAHNPEVLFLLENVKMKQVFQDVISEILEVKPVNINAALVSAQNRQRLFWTNIKGVEQPEDKSIFLKDILQETVLEKYFISNNQLAGFVRRKESYLQRGAGFGHVIADPKGKTKTIDSHYAKDARQCLVSCGSIIGRRIDPGTGRPADHRKDIPPVQRLELRADGKTGTLTTVEKDNVLLIQDMKKSNIRRLTPIECERLQCVPDNYTKAVSDTQRYKMLGNGWNVDVIAHIFKNINKENEK